jgi:hypothetical protein
MFSKFVSDNSHSWWALNSTIYGALLPMAYMTRSPLGIHYEAIKSIGATRSNLDKAADTPQWILLTAISLTP